MQSALTDARNDNPSDTNENGYTDHKCRFCGSTKQLHIHHIDGDHDHDNPANKTLLCRQCHRWLHVLRNFNINSPEANELAHGYNPTPLDFQIVLALAHHDLPVKTGEIAEFTDATSQSALNRLYILTALNITEPTRSVFARREATRWTFHGNIPEDESPVGDLPDDADHAARLIRDELIRQRLLNGDTPDDIIRDIGLARRTVYLSAARAAALQPPVPNAN